MLLFYAQLVPAAEPASNRNATRYDVGRALGTARMSGCVHVPWPSHRPVLRSCAHASAAADAGGLDADLHYMVKRGLSPTQLFMLGKLTRVQLQSIMNKHKVTENEAIEVRKCVWDEISKGWASQGKELVVAILSKKVDLNKTFYKIELPSLSDDSRVALFMCDCTDGSVSLLQNRLLSKREALEEVRKLGAF